MYPDTIYETPSQWGNVTQYFDHATLQQVAAELRDMGGEWLSCNSDEAIPWDLLRVNGGDAIYESRLCPEHSRTFRPGPQQDGEFTPDDA